MTGNAYVRAVNKVVGRKNFESFFTAHRAVVKDASVIAFAVFILEERKVRKVHHYFIAEGAAASELFISAGFFAVLAVVHGDFVVRPAALL